MIFYLFVDFWFCDTIQIRKEVGHEQDVPRCLNQCVSDIFFRWLRATTGQKASCKARLAPVARNMLLSPHERSFARLPSGNGNPHREKANNRKATIGFRACKLPRVERPEISAYVEIKTSFSVSPSFFYLAYSITRFSRITTTLISPGYFSSASISEAICLAIFAACKSSIMSDFTNTRISLPA